MAGQQASILQFGTAAARTPQRTLASSTEQTVEPAQTLLRNGPMTPVLVLCTGNDFRSRF